MNPAQTHEQSSSSHQLAPVMGDNPHGDKDDGETRQEEEKEEAKYGNDDSGGEIRQEEEKEEVKDCGDDGEEIQQDSEKEEKKMVNEEETVTKKVEVSLRIHHEHSLEYQANRVSSMSNAGHQALRRSAILKLAYESIGVVYGDLGTSPMYVFSSVFPKGLDQTFHEEDVLGALSLILYTLILVPLFKYAFIVLRANDNGDGGTFALYSLICRHAKVSMVPNQQMEDRELSSYTLPLPSKQLRRALWLKDKLEKSEFSKSFLLVVALFGTCMVIGDGVLTPCISVLSAVEGIKDATSSLQQYYVVGITAAIIIFLFSVQRFGTSKVGFIFAPAVLLWLFSIGGIGIYNVRKHDHRVFLAFNPKYIYEYFNRRGKEGWISLGGIVLCITGTEAMFADLGHFSVHSIQIAFSLVVFPCLLSAYMGQAAYLLNNPDDVLHAFYNSVPRPLYWPMFFVAVIAAIIASQAMISATFSIVNQSMALGCFPRVRVVHTSSKVSGQVYIPEINWILMVSCVLVAALFQTTAQLGNAYGIAVVGVMVVTTFLLFIIMILIWQIQLSGALAFALFFGAVDLLYFSSVLYKFTQGGYLPVAIALALLCIMFVWHYVTSKRYKYEMEQQLSEETFEGLVEKSSRVPGIGFVYTELAQGIPGIFAHMIESLPAIHTVLVFVCIKFLPVTMVQGSERFLIRRVHPRRFHIYRCVARYGYMEIRQVGDNFEAQLLETLQRFISSEVESELAPEVVDEISHTSISVSRGSLNQTRMEVEQELQILLQSRESGIVYMLGHCEVQADSSSSFLKRFAVNYVYSILRNNCRKRSISLIIPHQRLLQVGQIYKI